MLLVTAVLVFAWFAFVGFSALVVAFRRLTLRLLLLAPAIGTSLCVIALLTASRLGFTIGAAAWPLFAVLTVAALIIVFVNRATVLAVLPAERRYAAIAFEICVAAMLISGWPMLLYGSNWLSYGNDDMVNYSLGAMRLLSHYYYQVPNATNFAQGRDLPDSYFFLHVIYRERVGAELTLAFVSKLLGLIPFSAFMPVIVILHASFVAAVGALVNRSNAARFVAMGAISLSALETLGIEYQLLGQIFGLGLLLAVATLLAIALDREFDWRAAVLAGITGAGMLVAYPEVFPFLVLAYVFYVGMLLVTKSVTVRTVGTRLGLAFAAAIVVLNGQLTQTFVLLLMRATSTAITGSDDNIGLFPYYLIPSGIANLFGVLPVGTVGDEPFTSLAIAVGICACVMVGVSLYRGLRSAELAAFLLLAMLIFAVPLFLARAGFPLYKLAMYLQAPIVTTWAIVAVSTRFKFPFALRSASRVRST